MQDVSVLDLEPLRLDKTKVGFTSVIPLEVTIDRNHEDFLRNQMVVSLTAGVLSEKAHDPIRDTRTVRFQADVVNFPKWLPKFLKRRWTKPTQFSETVELEVQPIWKYPHANVPIPDLGRAYKDYIVYKNRS